MSEYIHDYLLLAERGPPVILARNLFAAHGESPGDFNPETTGNFRIGVYPVGGPYDIPIYYISELLIKESQRLALEYLESAGQVPGGIYYWRRNLDRRLITTNHPTINKIWLRYSAKKILDLLNLELKP